MTLSLLSDNSNGGRYSHGKQHLKRWWSLRAAVEDRQWWCGRDRLRQKTVPNMSSVDGKGSVADRPVASAISRMVSAAADENGSRA